MEKEDSKVLADGTLAEKCRKALENDLGFNIPLPNSKSQKTEHKEQKATADTAVAKIEDMSKDEMESLAKSIDATVFSKKLKSITQQLDKETLETVDKIGHKKRLSTDEFQKFFDLIWKKGPDSKVVNPNNWFDADEF